MNKFKLLFAGMLLAVLPAMAQNAASAQFIANAGFDDATIVNKAPKGWTLSIDEFSNLESTISTSKAASGLISADQNHWKLYQAGGDLKGKAFQKLKNIPAGRYRIKATIGPVFSGSAKLYINKTGAKLVSGTNKQYATMALSYDGTLEVGVEFQSTNGVNFDMDSFILEEVDMRSSDYASILKMMYRQCENDVNDKNRQAWYNKEEMDAAMKAFNEMGEDAEKQKAALKMMQDAHWNYVAISEPYCQMRDSINAIYERTKATTFACNEELKALYDQMEIYFQEDADHTDWMKANLANLQKYSDAFGYFQNMVREIEKAKIQLDYTNYPGKDEMQKALKESENILATAKTYEEYKKGNDLINASLATYLKSRPSEWITIQNGQLWKTENGQTVQAHAPGFVRVGDIWYMCGEDRANWWNPDVNLYSSVDLVHWKFENKIIKNGVTTPELGHGRMIERPKLLYNKKTDKYVVWCHYESGNYGASEAACFECDKVNGDYKVVWTGRPLDVKSRDCNVFQDNDGTAYFVSTTNENRDLGLFRLSDDYHEAIEHTALFKGNGREAPAIVRVGNRYFMFNSACSGWDPNQCKMSYTGNLKSGWTGLSNVGNPNAFDTQAAAILTITGTKATTYLYVGDRWQDPGLPETKTIIFPISFDGTKCNFKYHERFDINFVTGEWRETPTDGILADKTGWTVVEVSSQQNNTDAAGKNAIDGNLNTMWHTSWSPMASAPHSITIDMGKEISIKGFLATPRMDGSTNGLIRKYDFQVSKDNKTWESVSSGDWLLYSTEMNFSKRSCRYIKMVCKEGTYASIAEFDVVLADGTSTGINDAKLNAESEIVSRTYYTLDGCQIQAPQAGIYIERIAYQDGTTKSIKRFRK